jgi:hypothetical protein
MDQARRALIRETTMRPKITLKEMQSSTAEIGVSVHRTPLSPTLQSWASQQSGQKKISKHVWCLPKGMWETPQIYERRYSGQMRLHLSFLAIKENAMSGANPTPLIPCMVVAASRCGDVFPSAGTAGKFLRETCFSLPEI